MAQVASGEIIPWQCENGVCNGSSLILCEDTYPELFLSHKSKISFIKTHTCFQKVTEVLLQPQCRADSAVHLWQPLEASGGVASGALSMCVHVVAAVPALCA